MAWTDNLPSLAPKPSVLFVCVAATIFFTSLYIFWPLQTEFVLYRVCLDHGITNSTECNDNDHFSSVASRTNTYLGLAVSGPTIFTVLLFGALMDTYGRKVVMVITALIACVPPLCFFLVSHFELSLSWLFVGQIAQGMFGASTTVIGAMFAYVADTTTSTTSITTTSTTTLSTSPSSSHRRESPSRTLEGRAARFGWLNAAIYIGACLGPVIQGTMRRNNISYSRCFLTVLCICVANLLFLLFIPESLPVSRRRDFTLHANPFKPLSLIFEPSGLGRWGQLLLSIAFASIYATYLAEVPVLILFTKHEFDWSDANIGTFLSLSAGTRVLGCAVCLPVVLHLCRKLFGTASSSRSRSVETLLGGLGCLGYCFSFFMQSQAVSSALVFASLGFYPVAGFALPCIRSQISQSVAPSNQGVAFAALGSIESLFGTIGPLLFGILYSETVSVYVPTTLLVISALNGFGALLCLMVALSMDSSPASQSLLEDSNAQGGLLYTQQRATETDFCVPIPEATPRN